MEGLAISMICTSARSRLTMRLRTRLTTVGSTLVKMNYPRYIITVTWANLWVKVHWHLPHEADNGGEISNTRVSLSKHFSPRGTAPCEPIPILVYQRLGATHVEDHRVEATVSEQRMYILQIVTMYIHIYNWAASLKTSWRWSVLLFVHKVSGKTFRLTFSSQEMPALCQTWALQR